MTATDRSSSRVKTLAPEDQNKLREFENQIVKHPHLERVFDELMNTILTPAGANIVMVVGPTGVGKTALLRRTDSELHRMALADANRNPGHIPYGSIVLPSYEGGRFNWKNYHKRVLEVFDEPLIEHKTRYKPKELRADENGLLVIRPNPSTAELSDAVEQTLKHRGVRSLLIDEGGHFMKVAGGQALLDQMDTLKSLADRTGTLHVLFGPYEMLGLAELSPQLDRRTKLIHFPRYDASLEKDARAFKTSLHQFQQIVPLSTGSYLEDYWQELYAGSLGCVGILKDLLTAAISDGLRSKGQTLQWKHVEKQIVDPNRLSSRLRQIEEGEKRLVSSENAMKSLYVRLGLREDNDSSRQVNTSQSRKVGQRLPRRDPVGG